MMPENEKSITVLSDDELSQLISASDNVKIKNCTDKIARSYRLPDELRQNLRETDPTLSKTQVEVILESYKQSLKEQWLSFLEGNDTENRPAVGTLPPNYLLTVPKNEERLALKDSQTKKKYLKRLWELNKDELDKEEFIVQFIKLFTENEEVNDEPDETNQQKKKHKSKIAELFSTFSQLVGSIGYAFLVILGSIYSFRLFGGANLSMTVAGSACGLMFSTGSLVEVALGYSNTLYGKEKTAKWLKPILNTVTIAIISSLIMLGIMIDEMASVLSAATPFGMSKLIANIFTYATMSCSLVVGLSYTLTNYAFYRDLQKTAKHETTQTKLDQVLESKTFKKTCIGLNLFGGIVGTFFIGVLLASLIVPPGLGWGLGVLIGVAMLIQMHLESLDKLGVQPKPNSFNPLDRLYLFLCKRPQVRKAFSAVVALFYACGMLVFPYAVLSNLATSLPVAIPSLVTTITGLSLGVMGFLGSLYPYYTYLDGLLITTKDCNDAREMINEYEKESASSSLSSVVKQLSSQDLVCRNEPKLSSDLITEDKVERVTQSFEEGAESDFLLANDDGALRING